MHPLCKKTHHTQETGITMFCYQTEEPDWISLSMKLLLSVWDLIKNHIKTNQSPRCILFKTTLRVGREGQSNLTALLLVNHFQHVRLGKRITQKTTYLV